MKRLVSLILIVLGTGSVAPVAAADDYRNAVANPSAVKSTAGWAARTSDGRPVALRRIRDDGYESATSLQAEWTPPGAGSLATIAETRPRRHPITPGQVAYGRIALKLIAATPDARLVLAVSFYRADGTSLAVRPLEQARAATGRWQVLEGFDQAPPDTARYRLVVRVVNAGTAPARLRLAAAQAFRNPMEVPPVVLPTLTRDGSWSPSHGARSRASLRRVPVFGGQEYSLHLTAQVLKAKSSSYAGLRFHDSSGAALPGGVRVPIPEPGAHQVRIVAPAPRLAKTATISVAAAGRGAFDIRFDDVHLEPNREGDWPTRPFLVGFNDNSGIGDAIAGPREYAAANVATGANAVRFGAGRPDEAQPQRDGPIDWHGTRVAAYLDQLRAQGLKAIVIGGAPPVWMASTCAAVAADDYVRLGRAWAELVRLYPDVIAAVEWDNEPNTQEFWGGPPDPESYAAQLKAAAPLLHAASPGVQVLVGGLSDPPTPTPEGFTAKAFLSRAYAAGLGGAVDGVALHPYGPFGTVATGYGDSFVRGFYPTLADAREVMTAAGDGAKPIWVTEFGQTTERGLMFANTTELQQAQYDRMTSTLLRRMPGVASATVHTLRSRPDNPQGDFGVVDATDGRHKPAWDALHQEWRRSWAATR